MTTSEWDSSSAKAHVRQGQLLRQHLVLASQTQRRAGRLRDVLAPARFLGILAVVGVIAGFGAVVAFRSVSDGLGEMVAKGAQEQREHHDRNAVATARNRAAWTRIRRS